MKLSALASIAAFATISAVAHGQITIYDSPGSSSHVENVLFTDDSLLNTGTWVQGHTNVTNSIVNFTSSADLMTSGGQARLEGQFGTFNDLTLTLDDPNLWMDAIHWNLNAAGNGTVTFMIDYEGGSFMQTFDVRERGQNFFRIIADPGVEITSATLMADVGLNDVRQVRVGVVPEPGTLVGLSLGALALFRRKFKKAEK
jgi:hypothetical protein